MANLWANLSAEEFASAIYALLPQGYAWTREPTSNLSAFVHGVADGISQVHAHAALLSEVESDPHLTTAMLGDWERAYGLPDPCLEGVTLTTQVRRDNLVARVGDKGGQSIAYLIGVAEKLGFPGTTISEFSMFTADHGKAGDVVPSEDFLFAFVVNVNQSVSIHFFEADHSTAGDPLQYYDKTILECVFERIKPAHTHAIYHYHS